MSLHSDDTSSTPARPHFDHEIELLALLEDPVRRSLYVHVSRNGGYVSRDEAAGAVGIARGLAAFHLDKLADEGLLDTIYRRPPGRTGRGAGRPAKLYTRSRRQVSVSLPPRHYELLAKLLATALDQELPERVSGDLTRAAGAAGSALAVEARELAGRRPSRRRLVEAGLEVLWRQGYEPRRDGSEIQLRNCPFHAVARERRQLVCPVNLAMLAAFAGGMNVKELTPRLEFRDDACCVTFQVGGRAEAAAPAL
jgi:predicted ArsR family transcriptional regulator